MNFAANMLGLDNAATPLGLKAMQELQEINPEKETATNAQIMFLVLNTSGLTIIPISIMVYRAQAGAANPSDVFLPILLATFCSMFQHANIRTPRWLGYLITRPESHSVHHERDVHAFNYGDIPLFDILFGTFRNPREFTGEVGFFDGSSRKVGPMLIGREIA